MRIFLDQFLSNSNNANDNFVPMFAIKMEQPMAKEATTQTEAANNQPAEISVFDVKELYDLAYDRKAATSEKDDLFKQYLSQAVKMDLAYRRQLSNDMKSNNTVILQEAAKAEKDTNSIEVA